MKLIHTIRTAIEWVRLAVTQPREQLTAMQQKTRNAIEVLVYCIGHLREDRAPVLAAALAFRTLFGLLPVLVVATLTARAILSEDFASTVGELLNDLGLGSVSVAAAVTGSTPTDLASWLQSIVDDASKVNLSALGWVGFAVVSLSSIWLLVAIEASFNTIYRAPKGRSWPKRVVVYWFLLTGGPLLLVGLPWLSAHYATATSILPAWEWLDGVLSIITGTCIFWFVTLLAYLWIPNTRVHGRPAMIGALVAAILLELGKDLFGLYTSHALTLNQLYGSLGLIPLFMFWVYLMWMFVLFGLEVAAILQVLRGRRPSELNRSSEGPRLIDPAIILAVVALADEAFTRGEPLDVDTVAQELNVPFKLAQMMLENLSVASILRRLEENDQFVLARPIESINATEALAVGFAIADETNSVAATTTILSTLRHAQTDALADVTLGYHES